MNAETGGGEGVGVGIGDGSGDGEGWGEGARMVTAALGAALLGVEWNTLYTREAARDRERLPAYLGNLLSAKLALAALAIVVFAVALAVSGLADLVASGAALLVLTTYANLLRNTFYAVGRLEFEAIAI